MPRIRFSVPNLLECHVFVLLLLALFIDRYIAGHTDVTERRIGKLRAAKKPLVLPP